MTLGMSYLLDGRYIVVFFHLFAVPTFLDVLNFLTSSLRVCAAVPDLFWQCILFLFESSKLLYMSTALVVAEYGFVTMRGSRYP